MKGLYDNFPDLRNEKIAIRKMTEDDAEALFEISNNCAVYKYISPFLQNKSMQFLQTAIKNLGGRDFENKKMIIAGVYLQKTPVRLVGLAEMFDYKKKDSTITIGYRINETYWHQGIASNVIQMMVKYLTEETGIETIQAYVMPENIYSSKALLKNGFIKECYMEQKTNWGGHDSVDVDVYTYKLSSR